MEKSICLKRQDQLVLERIRIGHSNLTPSYMLNRELQPKSTCNLSHSYLTVQHIVWECSDPLTAKNDAFIFIMCVPCMKDSLINIDKYRGYPHIS